VPPSEQLWELLSVPSLAQLSGLQLVWHSEQLLATLTAPLSADASVK
jgi:hypothetical protein